MKTQDNFSTSFEYVDYLEKTNKEMLEHIKWCAEDMFCTGEDALIIQNQSRELLIELGEKKTWKG